MTKVCTHEVVMGAGEDSTGVYSVLFVVFLEHPC